MLKNVDVDNLWFQQGGAICMSYSQWNNQFMVFKETFVGIDTLKKNIGCIIAAIAAKVFGKFGYKTNWKHTRENTCYNWIPANVSKEEINKIVKQQTEIMKWYIVISYLNKDLL